jgi:hypothetical protein
MDRLVWSVLLSNAWNVRLENEFQRFPARIPL